MISSVFLLDIHFLLVLDPFDNISHWCSSNSFASVSIQVHLFQKFYDWHRLPSLPNLIHLYLYNCTNLTLQWTRSRFHSSSNYLQYRPHFHYRRHLTRLNTSESRCTTIPVMLKRFVYHSKCTRIVQADSDNDSDSKNCRRTAQSMSYVYQCRCLEWW
jgi:hypothetical protein